MSKFVHSEFNRELWKLEMISWNRFRFPFSYRKQIDRKYQEEQFQSTSSHYENGFFNEITLILSAKR